MKGFTSSHFSSKHCKICSIQKPEFVPSWSSPQPLMLTLHKDAKQNRHSFNGSTNNLKTSLITFCIIYDILLLEMCVRAWGGDARLISPKSRVNRRAAEFQCYWQRLPQTQKEQNMSITFSSKQNSKIVVRILEQLFQYLKYSINCSLSTCKCVSGGSIKSNSEQLEHGCKSG